MILSLDVGKVTDKVENLLKTSSSDIRRELIEFAEKNGVEIDS